MDFAEFYKRQVSQMSSINTQRGSGSWFYLGADCAMTELDQIEI